MKKLAVIAAISIVSITVRGEYSQSGTGIETYYGGIEVQNEPNDRLQHSVAYYINPTYGLEMAQDHSIGGTPLLIHDGLDTTNWTASAVSGTWGFASTDQAHTGSQSIDGTLTENGDIAEIVNGGMTNTYLGFSGWIYLTAWSDLWNNSIVFYAWNTNTAAQVGNSINLEDYINRNTLNEWQKGFVSLSDMGITTQTFNAIRMRVDSNTPAQLAPNFYLDDIELEETGGGVVYTVAAPTGYWMYLQRLVMQFEDVYDSTLSGSTEPNVNHKGILGLAYLENGLNLQLHQGGVVTDNSVAHNLKDIMFRGGATRIVDYDGSNTTITITYENYDRPVILKSETSDRTEIILSDDLSPLTSFRVALYVTVRPSRQ